MIKKIIYILILIILASSVYAAMDLNNILVHYTMDEPYDKSHALNKVYDETSHAYTANISGTVNSTGHLNESELFADAADVILMPKMSELSSITSLTVSAWIYPTQVTSEQYPFFFKETDGSLDNMMVQIIGSDTYVQAYGNTNCYGNTGSAPSINTWHHIVYVYNSSGSDNKAKLNYYLDGTRKTLSFVNTCPTSMGDFSDEPHYIGNDPTLNKYFHGKIDAFTIYYNVAYTGTQVTALYNGGTGYQWNNKTFSSLLINVESPANNTHINTNLTIKFNISELSNCSLLVNGSYNYTFINVPADTSQEYNLTLSVDASYNFAINCTSATAVYAQTGAYNFIYDTTQPFIYHNFPKNIYPGNNDIFNISANASDQYLYLVNLTITNASGYVMYNNFSNLSGTGWTVYDWNASIDTTAWQFGTYDVLIEATDSHTDEKLKEDFKPAKDVNLKKLSYFSGASYGNINVDFYRSAGECDISNFYDIEKFDRHSPTYEYIDCKKKHKETFVIVASRPLQYLIGNDEKYKGHLVAYNGMRGIWFDANLIDDPGAEYKIKKLTDYSYEIEITTYKDKLEFNSIGGLNYNSKTSYIKKYINITLMFNDTVTGTLLKNWYYKINGVTSPLIPGNKTKAFVGTVGGTYEIWGYNANFTSTPVNFTISAPRTIVLNASSNALIIYIYDEHTRQLINFTNVSIDIIGNTSGTYITDTGLQAISGLASGEYEIKYGAENYYTRSYYVYLNFSTTQTLYLYLLNTTEGTRIIHTLYDENSDRAEDITIKLMRYYTATNSFVVVQMQKTNFEGQAALYAELYDTYYKLMYSTSDNTTLKITNSSFFFQTETEDNVDLYENIFKSWREFDNGVHNLTFVNQSGVIYARYTYNVDGNLVETGCLQVQRYTTTGIYNVCNNCTTGSAAVLTCRINTALPGEYKAIAFIETNTANSAYTTLVEWYKKINTIALPKSEGIFLTAIIAGTFVMVGMASLAGSLMFLIVAVIAASLMQLALGVNIGIIAVMIASSLIVMHLFQKSEGS